jgi:dienelactone hydrolase
MRRIGTLVGLMLALGAVPAVAAFDPGVEAKNFSKTQERQAIYDTPEYQAQLRSQSTKNQADALAMQAKDPERQFVGDLCWNMSDGCAGDVRLYDWGPNGYGIVQPVLFTARNGATLSGRIWATKAGPAERPGIVITNGSVQADEPLYWFAAQTLAKAGYVVMTWDPQGQGQSDTRGEAPDGDEGFPAQSDGRPFFDGTQDALDFFFSTPSRPYVPQSSCSTGTSHAPKQARRVKAGLNAGFNPYWQRFDHKRVGLAGHSYGAAGVSYIGQLDKRVDAIVAWDNLSQPSPGKDGQNFPPGEKGCPAHPEQRVDLTKMPGKGAAPALGMSADYFLPPTPNTSEPPSPQHCDQVLAEYEQHGTPPSRDDGTGCKSLASKGYSHRGIDTGEIVIRGGSHLDFSFIPNHAFGASLRGADETAWYTTAWFDKYVKGDRSADERLLTNRWRHDKQEGAVDPDHDANMMSFYHPSRLAFHLTSGKRYVNEDLRSKASGLSDRDGFCGTYSYVAIARTRDTSNTDFHSCGAAAGCVNGRGGIAGTRLGAARLGRTRKKQRKAIKGKLKSRRGGIDRYCVQRGGALRIGYPTKRLQRSRALGRAMRTRRSKALLALTSSKRFKLRGLTVGSRTKTLRKKLRRERRFRVGRNSWYLVAGKHSRLLFQVRRGRVRQLGIASKGLTRTRRQARSFLRGWQL